MTEQRHRELVDYARERTGTALRGVVSYRRDSLEPVYRRDDVERSVLKPRVELTITQAQNKFHHLTESGLVEEMDWHVEFFDGVVLVYIREEPGTATLLSLETDLGGQLVSFLANCREFLVARNQRGETGSNQQPGRS